MTIATIIKWLISFATWACSFLPLHTPIEFPDMGAWFALFQIVSVANKFFPVPLIFTVLGMIVVFELAVLAYAAYRQILGLIPMLK